MARARSTRRRVWVLDPIDGTRSFITASPLWGTLIGVLRRRARGARHGRHAGAGRRRWVGQAGVGAHRNGVAVQASACREIARGPHRHHLARHLQRGRLAGLRRAEPALRDAPLRRRLLRLRATGRRHRRPGGRNRPAALRLPRPGRPDRSRRRRDHRLGRPRAGPAVRRPRRGGSHLELHRQALAALLRPRLSA